MEIKTIDVNALEWFDRSAGNSYFAGTITINFGTPDTKELIMPFQYGYGSHYEYRAMDKLKEKGLIKTKDKTLSLYCRENGIILRTNKRENCLKRELRAVN